MKPWVLLALIVLIGTSITDSARIFPSDVKVQQGGGFVLWCTGIEEIHKCELEIKGIVVTAKPDPVETEFGTIESLVTSNRRECGFRVKGVSNTSSGSWYLSYYNADLPDFSQRTHVQVSLIPREAANQCPVTKEKQCRIVNSKTKETRPCEKSELSLEEQCEYSEVGSMEIKIYSLKPVADDQDTSSIEDIQLTFPEAQSYTKLDEIEQNSVVLKCEAASTVNSCQAKHISSGRLFDMQYGLQTSDKKFSAFRTDLSSGRCQLELVKPIGVQDLGVWVLTMEKKNCTFMVYPNIKEPVVLQTQEDQVTITCAKNLNYPLIRCFILSLGQPATIKFMTTQEMRSGVCEFKNVNSSQEWYCGHNGPNANDTDIITKYSVKKYESALIEENVFAMGEMSIAEVQALNEEPISHCLILDPNGKMFSLSADQIMDMNLPYSTYGVGLEKGHCGIKSSVGELTGNWTFNVEMQDGTVHVLYHEVTGNSVELIY